MFTQAELKVTVHRAGNVTEYLLVLFIEMMGKKRNIDSLVHQGSGLVRFGLPRTIFCKAFLERLDYIIHVHYGGKTYITKFGLQSGMTVPFSYMVQYVFLSSCKII